MSSFKWYRRWKGGYWYHSRKYGWYQIDVLSYQGIINQTHGYAVTENWT